MSHLTYGKCGMCRFSVDIPKNHQDRFYKLYCVRFPPQPPAQTQDVWTKNLKVSKTDGCYEYQNKHTPEKT